MLTDKSFRRTVHCSKYSQLIKEKDHAPLITPFHIQTIDGRSLSEDSLNRGGMEVPVVVKSAEHSRKHLGLKLPPPDTSLSDIADTLGRHFPVKVIEVGAQHEIEGFTIGDYAAYLENRSSLHKLLNMISLEVSATALAATVLSPRVVRQIDWIDGFWPEERRARADYPRVQKYVLAGMAGSYTDFHVDFGGTSVWYHVIRGCKVFYLIPPTTENLRAYATWIRSASQDSTFFPETLARLGECKKVTITAGDTLLIPGGWIHAVYTPEDSLVIGGNFLLSPIIVPQLQVYGVEHRTRVGQKYRFPFFRQMVWYVLCRTLPAELKRQGLLAAPHLASSAASSDDEEDEEGEGEEEEDESSLMFPRVAWGWPYLVKMAAVWLAEGLPAEDRQVYEQAALRCLARMGRRQQGQESVNAILEAWWAVLATLPDSVQQQQQQQASSSGSDSGSGRDEHAASDSFRHYSEHLQKIRSYEDSSQSFDVLDDSLFEHYPYVNRAPSFYASGVEESAAEVKEIKCEQPAVNNVVKEEESEGKKDIKKMEEGEEEGEGELVEEEKKAPLKLSLKLKPRSEATSSPSSNSVSVSPPPPPPAAAPAHRVSKLVFKLKPEQKVTEAKTTAASHFQATGEATHGQQWGHSSSTTVTNKRSHAARTFGTRGKRLSAGFLQHAADFEVGGGGGGDSSSSEGGEEGEGEEYEANQHSRKRSRKYDEKEGDGDGDGDDRLSSDDEYMSHAEEEEEEEEEEYTHTVVVPPPLPPSSRASSSAPKKHPPPRRTPPAAAGANKNKSNRNSNNNKNNKTARARGAGSLLKERLKKKFS